MTENMEVVGEPMPELEEEAMAEVAEAIEEGAISEEELASAEIVDTTEEEEVAPTEPDPPPAPEPRAASDLRVVTEESDPEKFLRLRQAWKANGSSRNVALFGSSWIAVDDGTKFVVQGGATSAEGMYGSLSTGPRKK